LEVAFFLLVDKRTGARDGKRGIKVYEVLEGMKESRFG
jgi:hypothetical protein